MIFVLIAPFIVTCVGARRVIAGRLALTFLLMILALVVTIVIFTHLVVRPLMAYRFVH